MRQTTLSVIGICFSIHNAWSTCNIQYPANCSCFAFSKSMPDSGQSSVKKYCTVFVFKNAIDWRTETTLPIFCLFVWEILVSICSDFFYSFKIAKHRREKKKKRILKWKYWLNKEFALPFIAECIFGNNFEQNSYQYLKGTSAVHLATGSPNAPMCACLVPDPSPVTIPDSYMCH